MRDALHTRCRCRTGVPLCDAPACCLACRQELRPVQVQCQGCGCTDEHACLLPGGETCFWRAPGVCSKCWARAEGKPGGPIEGLPVLVSQHPEVYGPPPVVAMEVARAGPEAGA